MSLPPQFGDPQSAVYPNGNSPQRPTSNRARNITIVVIALFILLMIIVNSIKSAIPITVPDFKGQSLNLATSQAESIGLKDDNILSKSVSGESIWSSKEWEVCDQSIPPGSKIKKSSPIEFTVERDCSKVKDGALADVPLVDVTNMKLGEAKSAIAASSSNLITFVEEDFTKSSRSVWSDDNWIVCSQSPAANSVVNPKSEVVLYYARDMEECSTGKDTALEAQKQLDLEEENKAAEVGGLERFDSRASCDRWVDANLGSGFQARWYLGLEYEDVVDEGYGKMWQHNVTIKYKGDDVGTLICKVQGSAERPIIMEASVTL